MKANEQLVLYQTILQDIRDLKANQWRFSHYGLLLQATLVAIESTIKTPEWSPFDWVWALCVLQWGHGWGSVGSSVKRRDGSFSGVMQ